jgi:tetratricopeptide (TPR) repeat protein
VGKPTESVAECRKAILLLQELVDDDPSVADFRVVLAGCHWSLGILLLQAGRLADAEVECRMARAIYEKLAADAPSVKFNDDRVAESLETLGDVVRSTGRVAEAKAFYDRAIGLREQRLREDPTNPWYRCFVVSSLWRRGQTLRDLGDTAGAADDTRRALKQCHGLLPRCCSHLIETACCHAALAGLAGRSGSGVSAAEGQEAGNKAMEWLHRAVANGYRNTNQLRIESALDPLRNRLDFKKLMTELEKNAPGQQEKR